MLVFLQRLVSLREQLRQVMINLHAGLGDGEVEQMIRNADSNGDRKISYLEFQGINKQHFS